jgi:hypothetical protein
MNIPLGPSFETITANLLAPKQLLRPPPEDPGPYEPDERENPIEQQNTRNAFERTCIAGAIILVLAALVLML